MSCNITVSVSDDFAKEAKRLAKKYPSFKQDYKEIIDSIKENSFGKSISLVVFYVICLFHTAQTLISLP